MTPWKKAYYQSLAFEQTSMFKSAGGHLIHEQLDFLENELKRGLNHYGLSLLDEYVSLLHSLSELENQYEFYAGWFACEKHHESSY